MKIIVFGASGKTGKLVTEEALASGHEVTAYVRAKESITIAHPNLTVVEGQLNEKDKLKSVVTGADACISTLGGKSLIKHSSAVMEGIDNIVSIMEEVDVKRFLYLSSIGAGSSKRYMPQPIRFIITDLLLRVPLADHNANETRIMQSQLDWTIIRPGGLTDDLKTSSHLKHGTEYVKIQGSPSISRAQVASFLLSQLENSTYLNQCIWLYE